MSPDNSNNNMTKEIKKLLTEPPRNTIDISNLSLLDPNFEVVENERIHNCAVSLKLSMARYASIEIILQ